MSLIFQKWYSLCNNVGHYVALFEKFVDTPVNGRPSLFRIDSAHQMETSLSHALLVYYNTKSAFYTFLTSQSFLSCYFV
jgi:hypothetical protein